MMKNFYKRACLFLLLSFWTTLSLFGQSFSSFQNKYELAKELIRKKEYAQATTFLRDLTSQHDNNIYQEYASFFFAYAKYQLGEYDQARDMLLQVLQRYPDWEQIDEARYLMGVVQFARQKPKMALKYLQSIESSTLKPQVETLKGNYFPSYDKTQLSALFSENPKDEQLARALADRLAERPMDSLSISEKATLQRIERQFAYTPPQVLETIREQKKVIRKDKYYIGAFLPLLYQETQSDPLRSRYDFSWDLYQGMQMAAARLEQEEIPVELLIFDTERNPGTLQEVLERKNMEHLDLMVGPLFPETIPTALEFAQKNEVAILNPVSVNAELLEDYEHYYLTAPSYKTQAEKLAQFAIDSLKRTRFYIIYGGNSIDSLRAAHFREAVEAKGGFVRKFQRIVPSKNTYLDVHKTIKDIAPQALDPLAPIKDGDPDVLIFASTTTQAIASTINSRLLVSRLRIPVLAPEEWLEMSQMKLEQFNDREIYLFAPNYLDKQSQAYKEFEEEHYKRTRMAPSKYTVLGFESVYMWGKTLEEHGRNFWKRLPESDPKTGVLLPGFHYKEGKDNAILPILKMDEDQLRLMGK